jgi:DNA-binding transcriptional MerR regulator
VSTYTIGQVAERSGFTTSALRYYEGAGLLAPVARSESGYRLYDDAALSQLAFIARAKQLGCSLEEISALLGVWRGDECAPVQRRLHDLVSEKMAETQRQIAELTAFGDQLRHAAAQLAGPASDGPCSDSCACVDDGGAVAVRLGRPLS